MGGATLDEPAQEGQAMKINGSALLVQAGSREEALKVVEGDVYTKSGVWDTSKVGRGQWRKSVMGWAELTCVRCVADAGVPIQVGGEGGIVRWGGCGRYGLPRLVLA